MIGSIGQQFAVRGKPGGYCQVFMLGYLPDIPAQDICYKDFLGP